MRRCIVVGLLIFICFILQSTVFSALDLGGIVPNLMIVLTASFGFMRSEREGMIIGFISGLLIDIFFGYYIGMYALVYMYIGYLNGKFSRLFFPEDIKLPISLIVGSDIIYGLASFVSFLFRGKFHFLYYLAHVIVPEAVYTIIITIVLYPLILFINNKLEDYEKGRAKKFV